MRRCFSLGLLLAAVSTLAAAEDQIVVQIICEKAGQVSNGSGVIVSARGHVLTAAHVIPDGATCTARIGTTIGEPIPLTSIRQASNDLDAVLAILESDQTFVRFATV